MSLNVNNALYYSQGIDVNNINKVTNQIIANAQAQNNTVQVESIDYSQFNRKSLGVDLYSNRTNVDLQKQIALSQVGLLYTESVNIASLNSQAAANLYSALAVQKQVELTQSIAPINQTVQTRELEANRHVIEVLNTKDKNSNSSNGFNPFTSNEENTNEENNTETDGFNLFA